MVLKRIVLGACLLGIPGQTSATRASTRPVPSGNGGAVQPGNQIATDAIVVTGANAPASAGVLIAIVQLAVHYEFSNEAGARLPRQRVRQMFERGFFRRVRDYGRARRTSEAADVRQPL